MSSPAVSAWSRCSLGVGTEFDPHALFVVGVVGLDDGLAVEVPALAALGRPQSLGSFGAGRADGREGVPARDEDGFGLAGVQVGAAQLDRPHASAVVDGELAHDVTGQRHGQPLRPGLGLCHSASTSSESESVSPGPVRCQRVW